MEKLVLKYQLLFKALISLENSFEVEKLAQKINDSRIVLAAQDSIIQRFEYTYDSFWKFLKNFLEEKYNFEDINSPRSVFRACIHQQLCTEDEGEILLKMIGDRNETTHNYDIVQVRKILPNIGEYYQVMHNVIKKIKVS